MSHVVIANLIQRRVLTARDSVGVIAPAILAEIVKDSGEIAFDFTDIGAVSPSAIDQLLVSTQDISGERDIKFSNMPHPPSRVHEAIARAHGRKLVKNGPQSWVLKAPVERHA